MSGVAGPGTPSQAAQTEQNARNPAETAGNRPHVVAQRLVESDIYPGFDRVRDSATKTDESATPRSSGIRNWIGPASDCLPERGSNTLRATLTMRGPLEQTGAPLASTPVVRLSRCAPFSWWKSHIAIRRTAADRPRRRHAVRKPSRQPSRQPPRLLCEAPHPRGACGSSRQTRSSPRETRFPRGSGRDG